jgi:hypothetical protein
MGECRPDEHKTRSIAFCFTTLEDEFPRFRYLEDYVNPSERPAFPVIGSDLPSSTPTGEAKMLFPEIRRNDLFIPGGFLMPNNTTHHFGRIPMLKSF